MKPIHTRAYFTMLTVFLYLCVKDIKVKELDAPSITICLAFGAFVYITILIWHTQDPK